MLKGCYPSLHRSRLPPIFFLPLAVSCSLDSLSFDVYWTYILKKKFVNFEEREGRRRKEFFLRSINTKEKEKRREKIYIFAWVSFNHDQMYITSLFCHLRYWRAWILYFTLNIGLVWARAFLRIVRDSWQGEGQAEFLCDWWTVFKLNLFSFRRTPRRKLVFSSSDDETDDSPQSISSGKTSPILNWISITMFKSFSALYSSTRTSFDLSRWTVSILSFFFFSDYHG